MALADRVKNIIVKPAAEWQVIAPEPATVGGLYTGYIIPLAAIGPVCTFIGQAVFLHHVAFAAFGAVVSFVLQLVAVFVLALIADALVTSFGGVKNGTQSLKWVAYANTPGWVAGVFGLIPIVGGIFILLASLYGLYVLYLGAQPIMNVPSDKSVGYTVVVILCDIALFVGIAILVTAITAAIFGAGMMMGAGATQP